MTERVRVRPSVEFPALAALMSSVNGSYGQGTFIRGDALPGFTHLDSGIGCLDLGLLGGVPENVVTQFAGWPSSGKTTFAMKVVAAAQRKYPHKAAIYVDAEGTFDQEWAKSHGVDLERLYVTQPTKGEAMVDITEAAISNDEVSIVVFDSLPALVPASTMDNSAFDKQMADRARLIGILCSKIIIALAAKRAQGKPTTVIIVNQFRALIGGTRPGKTLPGGNQPRYLASVMVEWTNAEAEGKTEDNAMKLMTHNTHTMKITKSKIGNSIRTSEFEMVRDPEAGMPVGTIDDSVQMLLFANRMGLILGGGNKQRIQGIDHEFPNRAAMTKFMQQQPEEFNTLKTLVIGMHRQTLRLSPIPEDGYLLGRKDKAWWNAKSPEANHI